MKTILHPTDFSELSRDVLATALALAEQHRARLILLHVRQPQEVVEGEFGMIPPEPEPTDEELLAELRTLLPAERSAVNVELMVARGPVAATIVRVANSTQCDLIMLGAHESEGLLDRLFYTDIANEVKKDAPCRVVALSRAEAAQPAILW